MKLSEDILKLQDGGGTGMVFGHTYRPLITPQQTSTSSTTTKDKSSKNKSDDIVDKNTLKDLIGKGITSDVNASVSQLVQMQQAYDAMEDVDKNSNEGLMLLNQIQSSSAKVNQILRNAKLFDSAQKIAEGKKALNEFAVTESGLIVQELASGKIFTVPVEQIANADKEELKGFRFLTNAQLIIERETKLQYDTLSFEQLNNSTGFDEIKGYVKEALANLGNTSTTDTYDVYTGMASGRNDLKQALDQVNNLADTNIENITKVLKEESNSSQLTLVVDSVWSTLGENMKTFLKQKALAIGVSQGDLEVGAKSFIIKLISPRQSSTKELSLKSDLEKDQNGNTKKKGSIDEADKMDLGYWDYMQNGKAPTEYLPLAPDGTMSALITPTKTYGGFRDKAGKIYKNDSLYSIAELNSVAMTDAPSLGAEALPKSMIYGMSYQGDQVYVRELPYKYDASRAMIPDFALLPNYDAQLKEIAQKEKSGKRLSASERMIIFQSHNLKDLDANGNPRNVANFYQTKIYVGEQIYDELPETSQKYLTEVNAPGANEAMNNTFAHSKETKKGNANVWEDGDSVYVGQIYFPQRKYGAVGASQIEDSKLGLLDWRRRATSQQAQQGVSNQAIAQPQNMDYLNLIFNDK